MATKMPLQRVALYLVCAVFALKLALWMWLGPQVAPDTRHYAIYAEAMSKDSRWLTAIDWKSAPAPSLTLRMIGYPALIYISQSISLANWQWLLTALQILLSVYVTLRLFLVLGRLCQLRWLAVALALAHATSVTLMFDQFILTDAVNLSALLLATLAMLELSLGERTSWWRLAEIALGFLFAFLMRDATAMLMWFWLPLLAVALSRSMSVWRAAAIGVALLAPTLIAKQVYAQWNVLRTGDRFVTTSYQSVLALPLVKAYQFDKTIFGGDNVIDRVARETITRHTFDDVLAMNHRLHAAYGVTAPQMMREMERRFWRLLVDHPRAFLLAFFDRQRVNYAFSLVAPLSSVNSLVSMADPSRNNFVSHLTLRRHVFSEGRVQFLPLLLIDVASRAASILILMYAFAGTFLMLRRRRELAGTPLVLEAIAMAALVGSFYMAHAIVNLEERYLMPMFPVVLMMFAIAVRLAPQLGLPVVGARRS